MTDDFDPLKEALRDSLHRHAADAPRGELLAERIIQTAQHPAPAERHRPRHGWRTWALPLVAAGAVGAVVTAVVGIQNLHTSASKERVGTSRLPSMLPSQPPTHVLSTHPSPPHTTTTGAPAPTGLAGVKITDLTFAYEQGWALGSAECLSGPGRCTALWHTVDGRHWTSMGGERFNVDGVQGCADPCVHNIRFASREVGYAYGPSAFFMTTNGGASWQRQDGGAIQLETLDGNVIRVTGTASGCPGPCVTGIETSGVGSTHWTAAAFPQNQAGTVDGVLLVRGLGGDAYLLMTGHAAGGAQNATSTLYRSTDAGATWHDVGEPCPQVGGEVDSISLAAGDGGRVAALCATRQAPQTYRVATSSNAGASFGRRPGTIPITPWLVTGDPQTVLIAAGVGMARSTDGGLTWQKVTDVTGRISWVGFESQQVGRALSADGTTIWTTRDGGATWRPAAIG